MTAKANAVSTSDEDPILGHYTVNVFYPLLDHIISELDHQFTSKLHYINAKHCNIVLFEGNKITTLPIQIVATVLVM